MKSENMFPYQTDHNNIKQLNNLKQPNETCKCQHSNFITCARASKNPVRSINHGFEIAACNLNINVFKIFRTKLSQQQLAAFVSKL